ncbi:hypothetical protein ABID21_001899 [Pseudorhizobium tarimense]|uniref:Uncharacterized protein n=1 Tax=Pseudorhizobium tarimense TaxID=1079109 RepID=A0ABV2H5G6_9HYPH|nr:hypothetical protein [Pseudorhizobium tarimense]MCJ8518993.1 hypothetical protein [Pseudorhizobium tarimense]
MTNRFDFGSMPVKGGFLAFYRMVHHSKNFILRDGKLDRLFATAEEAELEAGKAFKEYLNSPISGMTNAGESQWDAANAAFNLPVTERPTVIKQRGKGKRIEVDRRAIA